MRTSRVRLPLVTWALALAVSLVPTMLPRPALVQGIVSAVIALQGCLAGVVAGVAVRRSLWAARVWTRCRGPLAVASVAALVAATFAGHSRSTALRTTMGLAPAPWADTLIGLAIAVALSLAVVAVVQGGVRLGRRTARSRRLRTAVVAPLLAVAATAGLVPATVPSAQAATTPTVNLARLDAKGRQFLGGTPTAAGIARITGHPASTPTRLYVGLRSAPSATARADLAVGELERSGGFDRRAVVLVLPTGSGWVDPAGIASVEYLLGGDVASVAVQYADTPSWIAYLRGTGDARRTARALIEAVHDRVERRPAGRRPQVLVFGESLGALAGLTAEPRAADLTSRTDGGLWVGVPAPARARAAQVVASPSGRRQSVLVHRDDPVAAWSAPLLSHPTPYWHRPWAPVLSFWEATADLASAYWTPDGYGHRYSREMVDAWRTAIGGPTLGADRLDDVRDAVGTLGAEG